MGGPEPSGARSAGLDRPGVDQWRAPRIGTRLRYGVITPERDGPLDGWCRPDAWQSIETWGSSSPSERPGRGGTLSTTPALRRLLIRATFVYPFY